MSLQPGIPKDLPTRERVIGFNCRFDISWGRKFAQTLRMSAVLVRVVPTDFDDESGRTLTLVSLSTLEVTRGGICNPRTDPWDAFLACRDQRKAARTPSLSSAGQLPSLTIPYLSEHRFISPPLTLTAKPRPRYSGSSDKTGGDDPLGQVGRRCCQNPCLDEVGLEVRVESR